MGRFHELVASTFQIIGSIEFAYKVDYLLAVEELPNPIGSDDHEFVLR
jgi:hypothetical protein